MDGEWCFSPDEQTVTDIDGNVNNFIDTRNYLAEKSVIYEFTNFFYGQDN